MKSDRNLFFNAFDYCKPGIIQGFDSNFNFKGCKIDWFKQFMDFIQKYLSGVGNSLFFNFQYFIPIDGKIIKNRIFLVKVRPVSLLI